MTTLQMTLATIEGRHLLALVDEFITLLDGPRDEADPALDRLAPAAYPDDPEASAEFSRSTREDGFDRRLAEALEVRTSLEPFDVDSDGRDAARQTAHDPISVDIDVRIIDAWLRTLSAIRLVLASRLGVDRSDAHDADDVRFGTYDWLGYRLEVLIQLADQHDAR